VYEFLEYRVADAMTRNPVTITPRATLAETERLFERHDFNGLPVVDGDGRLLGFATKLDLLKAFQFTRERIVPPYDEIMGRTVDAVMTRDVECASPEMPLTRVLQRMIETRNRSLPVVDDERLVGVIAREDVLRAVRGAVAGEAPRSDSR
jgi:CBS domain-containing protein